MLIGSWFRIPFVLNFTSYVWYFLFFCSVSLHFYIRSKCRYAEEFKRKSEAKTKKQSVENAKVLLNFDGCWPRFRWISPIKYLWFYFSCILSFNMSALRTEIVYECWLFSISMIFSFWLIGSILSSNGKKFGISEIENHAVFHIDWMRSVCSFVLDVVKCIAWRFVDWIVFVLFRILFFMFVDRAIVLGRCMFLRRWSILKMNDSF